MGVNEGDELGLGIFVSSFFKPMLLPPESAPTTNIDGSSAIALEKRTINIRVERDSELLALELAAKKLKASQDWVKRTDQVMLTLLWVGSAFSGVLFYFFSIIAFGVWFYAAGTGRSQLAGAIARDKQLSDHLTRLSTKSLHCASCDLPAS